MACLLKNKGVRKKYLFQHEIRAGVNKKDTKAKIKSNRTKNLYSFAASNEQARRKYWQKE